MHPDIYKDLRMAHKPYKVSDCLQELARLNEKPMSSAKGRDTRWEGPLGVDDRTCGYLWMRELARIGFFVNVCCDERRAVNCEAFPGAKGQNIVKTELGTLILVLRTGRIRTPNNAHPELLRRLRLVFPASME